MGPAANAYPSGLYDDESAEKFIRETLHRIDQRSRHRGAGISGKTQKNHAARLTRAGVYQFPEVFIFRNKDARRLARHFQDVFVGCLRRKLSNRDYIVASLAKRPH